MYLEKQLKLQNCQYSATIGLYVSAQPARTEIKSYGKN